MQAKRSDPVVQPLIEVGVLAIVGLWADWPAVGWMVAAYLPIRWLSVAAHELGHALGAMLGGMYVWTVSIGVGGQLGLKIGNVHVKLGWWPSSGFVAALATQLPGYRRSRLLHLAGGAAANLLVLLGVLIVWPGPIGWAIVAAQIWLLISALAFVEGNSPDLAGEWVTDGLAMLRLLLWPEDAQPEREPWLGALIRPDVEPSVKLTAATELLKIPDLDPSSKQWFMGAAAYYVAVLGLEDRYAEADRLSAQAVELDPSDANVDTRGCVLAAMGAGMEAIPMLERGLIGIEALGLGDEERGWCHSFMAKAYLDAGAEAEARSHASTAADYGASIPALREVQERLGIPHNG